MFSTDTELIEDAPPAVVPRRATAAPGEDDAALVARCRRGDATAWTALVRRYQRLVYAIACRAGLDEHVAADVFQTVFSRLVEQLPRITEPQRLQAWIVTTAKRETLLLRRRGQRLVSMTSTDDDGSGGSEWDVVDESPIAEQALADLQQVHRLRLALERLDERSRTLVELLFRDEDERLPYEQIAQRLGLPVGSIGPTRARCLDKLRKLMQQV
ncbi:MAG TPA: sigma-70 family RNA polymerase sigma factor [Gemmatimonadales bacterium]|nr:sigma-70 family RNA polymerase sigma factor [Gemmatimonadales bacterium]